MWKNLKVQNDNLIIKYEMQMFAYQIAKIV